MVAADHLFAGWNVLDHGQKDDIALFEPAILILVTAMGESNGSLFLGLLSNDISNPFEWLDTSGHQVQGQWSWDRNLHMIWPIRHT